MGIRITRDTIPREHLKVPPLVGKSPYEDFQFEDVNRIYRFSSVGLRQEQGTGKGWITISAIDQMYKKRNIKKVLYLTSGPGVYNMKKAFKMFSDIPHERITIANKNNRKPFIQDYDVVIASHRSFLLVQDAYQKEINPGIKDPTKKTPMPLEQWIGECDGVIVVDECHHMTNPKSRGVKALMLVAPHFKYRYPASGTPADKPEKWYSLLKFMDDDLVKGKNYYEWLTEYAVMGTKWSPWAIAYFKPNKLQELNTIISQNWIDRKASDCLVLPPHKEKKMYIEFTRKHEAVYRLFVELNVRAVQKEKGYVDNDLLFSKFPFLMLAIENPEMILNRMEYLKDILPETDIFNLINAIDQFNFKEDHSKLQPLMDLLEEHEGSKIIIWTYHPSTANYLAEILKDKRPHILHGEIPIPKGMTTDEYKDKVISEFKYKAHMTGEVPRDILIAGIPVLNSSVTIVESNVQIYFETTFNYTNTDQSKKRIYRAGQDKEVHTYYLIMDNSLNVAQYENIGIKDIFNKMFGVDSSLNLTQIQDLFTMEGG